jgi:hypothetical protein
MILCAIVDGVEGPEQRERLSPLPPLSSSSQVCIKFIVYIDLPNASQAHPYRHELTHRRMTNAGAHPRLANSGQEQIQSGSGRVRTADPSRSTASTSSLSRIGAHSPAHRSPSPDSDEDFLPVPFEVTVNSAGPTQVSIDASFICSGSLSHKLPNSRHHR